VHKQAPDYFRERDAHLRLQRLGITTILGCSVPELIDYDNDLWIIVMTVVDRPFVLDFGGAFLDQAPEFADEIMAEWEIEKQEQFGPQWAAARAIIYELQSHGIYSWSTSIQEISLSTIRKFGLVMLFTSRQIMSNHDHHIHRIMLFHRPPQCLDLVGAFAAARDEQYLIFLEIDNVLRPAFEAYKVRCGKAAQEYRGLAAKAEVFAGAGDLAEALGMADVIGHQVGVHRVRRHSPRRWVSSICQKRRKLPK